MFKTSGGKYVAPQLIENALKESRFIEQCIVVGDGRPYPIALLVPNFDAVKEWCSRHSVEYTTPEAAVKDQRVSDRIWRDVNNSNQKFGKWEQVKRVWLLPALLTIEAGELTPTLKLKRKAILERYAKEIEGVYAMEK
jgi:long-chain acyl-CoA synthetase